MKRILITGANGFTGSNLIDSIKGPEWEIIPLTHREIPGQKHENEVIADFCDPLFPDILRKIPPVDTVVHLGTRPGWDGSTRPELFKPNILATAQLTDWAQKNNSHFIFASAALICGEQKTLITQYCIPNTQNDYLYSKWLAEEIIKMSGIRHTILRISGIFGKNGPSHLGINRAINGALEGNPPTQFGDGSIRRNYIYVKDLCEIIKFCILYPEKTQGTHLAGASHVNSIAEMLKIICAILLPGTSPEIKPGEIGYDQIIEPSNALPPGRTFLESILDIKKNISKQTNPIN